MKSGRMLLGVAVGAALALMIAPKTGREMRQDVKELWEGLREEGAEPAEAFKGFWDKVAGSCCKEEITEMETISPSDV